MSNQKEKTEPTKEEIAEFWRNYYDLVDTVYPLRSFEIKGKDGEMLNFYHGFNLIRNTDRGEEQLLLYCLKDAGYQEAYEEKREKDLAGEKHDNEGIKSFEDIAFIAIDRAEKYFNFGVEWKYQGQGYGEEIYHKYLQILEMLRIEEPEKYQLRVYGNSDHDFFKRMATRELVTKASGEPNSENAMQLIQEFGAYPNSMRFSELNAIVQYAINSNVPAQDIAEAINSNGFNIEYSTSNNVPHFEREDLEKFKAFGITGLRATAMHEHFMSNSSFGFIQVLDDLEEEDATLEFRRVFEEVKSKYENGETKREWVPTSLTQYGELGYIILDWEYAGQLFKNVSPEIQQVIRKYAIRIFGEFDPEHKKSWSNRIDIDSEKVLRVLSDAGLMSRDTYIELYQKALNRNYNLSEFDRVVEGYINIEERGAAREEIYQNAYYPSPKRNWQKSGEHGKNHKISRIEIPQEVIEKGDIIETIKKAILEQGVASKTRIKTDMMGIGEDGEAFTVNNLADWLFGVPGAYGNLQIRKNRFVILPPQTPQFATNLINQVLKHIEYPGFEDGTR